jgi:hypothetical protein
MSLLARRATLLAILLVAAFFRFWQIDLTPPGFHFDEAYEGVEAWRILTDSSYRPLFLSGNFGVAPLNAYANALMFGLFRLLGGEAGPTAMRVTAACLGVLSVLAVYALAAELQRLPGRIRRQGDKVTQGPGGTVTPSPSPAFPLFAAAALAVMRWHVHFSRMGIEPIFTPLLWATSMWLLLRGWRTGQWFSFAACGVSLAASMYAYQGAWVIPFLGALVGIRLLTEFWKIFLGLVVTGVVAAVLFAPLGWYFWQHPDVLVLRPAQIAVSNTQAGTPSGPSENTWRAVWATLKMFSPFGAGAPWAPLGPGDLDPRRNLPGAPALNLWLAIPFFIGLGLTLWRIRSAASAILLLGLLGLLLPGMFSEEAPHYHRILGAAAPAALLCGVGLEWLWRVAGDKNFRFGILDFGVKSSRRTTCDMAPPRPLQNPKSKFQNASPSHPVTQSPALLRWASVLLLLCGAIVSARDYFWRWAALPDLYYAFDVGLWDVGRQLAAVPDATPVYLTPRDAGHPTLAFAFQGKRPVPVSFDGRHVFPLTTRQTTQPEIYAVIEHEDFRTPLLLPEVFPAATAQEASRDAFGRVYARFYTRPAGVLPQRPPQQPFEIVAGDGIHLAGYDVQPRQEGALSGAPLHPGEILYLQLHWQVDAPPQHDWTVFTHLLAIDVSGNANVVAGQDSRPGNGSLPTTRWQAGWRVMDEYQIALPAELSPGVYQLEIGLYQINGARLPVDATGIRLGEVTLE